MDDDFGIVVVYKHQINRNTFAQDVCHANYALDFCEFKDFQQVAALLVTGNSSDGTSASEKFLSDAIILQMLEPIAVVSYLLTLLLLQICQQKCTGQTLDHSVNSSIERPQHSFICVQSKTNTNFEHADIVHHVLHFPPLHHQPHHAWVFCMIAFP